MLVKRVGSSAGSWLLNVETKTEGKKHKPQRTSKTKCSIKKPLHNDMTTDTEYCSIPDILDIISSQWPEEFDLNRSNSSKRNTSKPLLKTFNSPKQTKNKVLVVPSYKVAHETITIEPLSPMSSSDDMILDEHQSMDSIPPPLDQNKTTSPFKANNSYMDPSSFVTDSSTDSSQEHLPTTSPKKNPSKRKLRPSSTPNIRRASQPTTILPHRASQRPQIRPVKSYTCPPRSSIFPLQGKKTMKVPSLTDLLKEQNITDIPEEEPNKNIVSLAKVEEFKPPLIPYSDPTSSNFKQDFDPNPTVEKNSLIIQLKRIIQKLTIELADLGSDRDYQASQLAIVQSNLDKVEKELELERSRLKKDLIDPLISPISTTRTSIEETQKGHFNVRDFDIELLKLKENYHQEKAQHYVTKMKLKECHLSINDKDQQIRILEEKIYENQKKETPLAISILDSFERPHASPKSCQSSPISFDFQSIPNNFNSSAPSPVSKLETSTSPKVINELKPFDLQKTTDNITTNLEPIKESPLNSPLTSNVSHQTIILIKEPIITVSAELSPNSITPIYTDSLQPRFIIPPSSVSPTILSGEISLLDFPLNDERTVSDPVSESGSEPEVDPDSTLKPHSFNTKLSTTNWHHQLELITNERLKVMDTLTTITDPKILLELNTYRDQLDMNMLRVQSRLRDAT